MQSILPGFIESGIFLLAPDLFSGVGQFGQLLRVGRVQLFGLLLQLFNLVRTDLLPLIRDLFADLKLKFKKNHFISNQTTYTVIITY
jgi:hypothetical protein